VRPPPSALEIGQAIPSSRLWSQSSTGHRLMPSRQRLGLLREPLVDTHQLSQARTASRGLLIPALCSRAGALFPGDRIGGNRREEP